MLNEDEEAKEEDRGGGNLAYSIMDKTTLTL